MSIEEKPKKPKSNYAVATSEERISIITTSQKYQENPTISVIIAVYNAEKWVVEAVASIVNQKYVAEVLLVEDGSTDKSLSLCLELAAAIPQVHVFRHDDGGNHGAGASWNLGIRHARLEFIAILGADDICLPDRFDLPLQILAENPAIDGVYEAIGTIFEDENAKRRWDSLGSLNIITTIRKVLQPDEVFYYLVMGGAEHFSLDGFVVRKNLFYRVGGFNTSLRLHQDTDICIKMAAVGNLVPGRLSKPVALRRVHSDNRFVKERNDALQSRLLMWRSLDDWAKESNQNGARRLVVRCRLNQVLKARSYQQRKWLSASFYFAMSRLMRAVIYVRRTVAGARSF